MPNYAVGGQVLGAPQPPYQVYSTPAPGTSNAYAANPSAYPHYPNPAMQMSAMAPPSYEDTVSKPLQSNNPGTQHNMQYDGPAQGGSDTFAQPPPMTGPTAEPSAPSYNMS